MPLLKSLGLVTQFVELHGIKVYLRLMPYGTCRLEDLWKERPFLSGWSGPAWIVCLLLHIVTWNVSGLESHLFPGALDQKSL